MSSIPYNLSNIRAFIFDVDGVLSSKVCALDHDGIPLRTACVRDGFAITMALHHGYKVAVITGGDNSVTQKRMQYLGSTDFYNHSRNKLTDYEDFKKKYGLKDHEIVYIGDDLPDLEVMQTAGLSVAPVDAAPEVLEAAVYISPVKGGEGVARDVIEQVLRAEGLWHFKENRPNW